MSTEIDIISNIPINLIMVDQFAKYIGLPEVKMNKLKKHAYEMGYKFLVKAPDGHIFININLFNLWALQNNVSKNNLKLLQIPYLIITAAQYARITGYTIKAIERKREDKIWDARIAFKDPLGNLSINIKEAENWIEGKKYG